MKNSIAQRIADFLKNFPPFERLNEIDLLTLCNEIEIAYYQKNETCFPQGNPTHQYFYVVKEGAVDLWYTSDISESLLNQCDEGDILIKGSRGMKMERILDYL